MSLSQISDVLWMTEVLPISSDPAVSVSDTHCFDSYKEQVNGIKYKIK